jgi:small-conductance mechanosensitive channel
LIANFRQWLQTDLGLGPGIQEALLFPFLAVFAIWLLRQGFLALVYLKIKDPERRQRWRVISFYTSLVVGAAVFGGIWLASLRRIALFLGARTEQESQQIQVVLAGVVYALLATLGLFLLLRFLSSLVALVSRRTLSWSQAGPAIEFRGLELITRDRVRDSIMLVTRVVRGLVVLLLFYIYIPLLLSFFPRTAPYGDRLFQYVADPAGEIVVAVLDYIPNLIYLILIVISVRYALKLLRFLLEAVGEGNLVVPGFEPEWADPTYKLLRAVAMIFTLMISYPYLPGAQSEFFRGFSLFVGALVTLGSTAAVGNLVSGVVLTYTGAFRIGDRVRIGDTAGDVLTKSLFVTRIRTVKNEEVTIPNGVVLSGQVVNYTAAAKRKELVLNTEVGIGYDVHWSKVHELLKNAAARTDHILSEPEPFVWQTKLGDFAVVYQLNACTEHADRMGGIYSALRQNILDVFHDAGVEIMTPTVEALRDASSPAIPTENEPPDTAPPHGIRIDATETGS